MSLLHRPPATLESAAFNAIKCGGSRKLSPRRSRARPPGGLRARDSGEQLIFESDGLIVTDDTVIYRSMDSERGAIGARELRSVCTAPFLRHPPFENGESCFPVAGGRVVDVYRVANFKFRPCFF